MDSKIQNFTQNQAKTFENVIVQQIGTNRKIPILPKPPLLDEPKIVTTPTASLAKIDNRSGVGIVHNTVAEIQCQSRPVTTLEKTNTTGIPSNELTKAQPISTQGLLSNTSPLLINSTGNGNHQNLIKILPKLPVKSIQRNGNVLVQGPNNKILSLQIKPSAVVPTVHSSNSGNSTVLNNHSANASNTNKNMQILQNKTTSDSIFTKTSQSILTTPTTTSTKTTQLTSLPTPSTQVSTAIPIYPTAKVTSQTILSSKIVNTKASEMLSPTQNVIPNSKLSTNPGISSARNFQQSSNILPVSQVKINENVAVNSIQQKQMSNSPLNKSNMIPIQYNKTQATNSVNITQSSVCSPNTNSSVTAQTLPCGETALSISSGPAGISAKKILLPMGKISSNITISKAPLNSRHGPIEEPSPSISLIEKRNIITSSSSTVSVPMVSSQNTQTSMKSTSTTRINSLGATISSSEMLNVISKDINLHSMSKLSKCNENKSLPTFCPLNNNEENITIITQFIPEQKPKNSASDRTDVEVASKAQTFIVTQPSYNINSKADGGIVTTSTIITETINVISQDQIQNIVPKIISDAPLFVSAQRCEEKIVDRNCKFTTDNLITDVKSDKSNTRTDLSCESSNGHLELENKKNNTTTNNSYNTEVFLDRSTNKPELANDGKTENAQNNEIDFNQSTIEGVEINSQKTPQKLVRTSSNSGKLKGLKQQSLLKNKNIEILKQSPRTLGRSKSLSYRHPDKKGIHKRRLSATSDSLVNNKKVTKDVLVNRVLALCSNSDNISLAKSMKTTKSSNEKLNQTLLCEEKIEISPNVSGESNNSANNNITDARQPSLKTRMNLEQNLDSKNLGVVHDDLKSQHQKLLPLDNKNGDVQNNDGILNGNNTVFIEQIISNIKSNASAQNAVQINELANILKWRTGIGLTKDAGMAFRINELGLLEIFEKNVNRNRLDIAYEKPIYQREKQSHKVDEYVEPIYFCKGCNCHGPAVDFLAPEYCSHDCITHYDRKKLSKSSNLQQIYINQQRQKKLRKQKMSSLLNDSSISLLNSNMTPKREFSWTSYLNASNSEPAPIDLFLNPFPCGPNLFQVGMKLEAIDPEYSSLFCVCSVVEIKGYRLKIHFDGYSSTYDFWINADSMDIFPPGWCNKTNRALQPPKYMNASTFNWSTYLMQTKTIPAPRNLFTHLNSSSNTNPFKTGVRFEADDLRNTRKVCVASVADVLDNRILVHFDGWDDRYDYWVDCNSPYIHPVNWHLQNNFEIVPPPDWKDIFDWRTYLNSINGIPATDDYFQTREPISFKIGMKLEIVDKKNPSLIRPGTVIMTDGYEIKVLFDGWSLDYSFWVVDDSPEIHPIGWCDATGHELETPTGFDSLPSILPCPVAGCRGIGNAKRFDIDFHATEDSCPYLLGNWKKELEKPERIDYAEINIKENNNSQKRKHNDSNWEIPLKYRKVEGSSDNFNISDQLTSNLDSLSFGNTQGQSHNFQHQQDSNDNKFQMKKEHKSDESIQDNTILDPKIEITKHLLCDYGPRLEQNYKLWLKYAQHITEKLDKIHKNPLQWRVDEVVKFFNKIPQCKDICEQFYKEDIDGEALLSLRQKDLTDILKIKLGTAIKINNVIILLRAEVISRFS